jgi:hypothetical protein
VIFPLDISSIILPTKWQVGMSKESSSGNFQNLDINSSEK